MVIGKKVGFDKWNNEIWQEVIFREDYNIMVFFEIILEMA